MSDKYECDHCKDTGTTAGPAGPNAYPCPFCVGGPLGKIDDLLKALKSPRTPDKS